MLSLTPWQWFNLVAAIVSTWAAWRIIDNADRIVEWLFPDSEWEKSLGWLNITATKRAEAGLRWVGYLVYAMLAAALYGIVWAAQGLRDFAQWSDPDVLSRLALHFPVLVLCLVIWFLYFGLGVMPRVRWEREEREWRELQKFREQMAEQERLRPPQEERSRLQRPLRKPRVNAPHESILPDRGRKRR